MRPDSPHRHETVGPLSEALGHDTESPAPITDVPTVDWNRDDSRRTECS
jgi:hypothetical protein